MKYAEGLAEGKANGLVEGLQKGKIETDKNLLSLNVSAEMIMEATGLSKEEINNLEE